MKTLSDNPQFKAFATSINYGIIVADTEGKIVDFNDAAMNMFGFNEQELQNAPLTTIMPARFRTAHEVGLQRFKETGQGRILNNTVRLYGQHKSGKEIPVEMHLSSWESNSGKLYFTASLRQYSALENNLSWILASSAAATVTLVGLMIYMAFRF